MMSFNHYVLELQSRIPDKNRNILDGYGFSAFFIIFVIYDFIVHTNKIPWSNNLVFVNFYVSSLSTFDYPDKLL